MINSIYRLLYDYFYKMLTLKKDEVYELHNEGLLIDTALLTEVVEQQKTGELAYKKKVANRRRENKDLTYEENLGIVKQRLGRCNATLILTGKRNCPKNVFVLDIDTKEEKGLKQGMTKWESLINEHGEIEKWICKTGNNGKHYYFDLDERLNEVSIGSKLKIDGEQYSIDWRGNGGIIFCPPTTYTSIKDGTKEYKWFKSPKDTKLSRMPDWLYEKIKENFQINFVPKKQFKTATLQAPVTENGWLMIQKKKTKQ